jgi:hypothetical protein
METRPRYPARHKDLDVEAPILEDGDFSSLRPGLQLCPVGRVAVEVDRDIIVGSTAIRSGCVGRLEIPRGSGRATQNHGWRLVG